MSDFPVDSAAPAAPRTWRRRVARALHHTTLNWLAAAAAALAALYAYVPVIHPGAGPVRFLDSLQYQIAVTVMGVTHPPSHPLYLFLARAFTALPLPAIGRIAPYGDNIAFRLGLFSALAAALTVFIMVRLVYVITHNVPAALLAGLVLAGATGFWVQATYVELYPLYNLFVALTFLLLVRWMQTRQRRFYFLSALVLALSFGVNVPAVMLLPAWLWAVLVTDHRMLTRPRNLLLTGLMVLLGAAQFLYVPLRAFVFDTPPFCNFCPTDWSEVPAFLTGAHWRDRGIAFGLAPQWWMQRWADSGYQMMLSFWPVGLLLAAAGWLHLLRRRRRLGGMLTLALGATWFFAVTYDVPDWSDFMTPVYVLMTPLIGVGALDLWELAQRTSARWTRLGARLLRPLLLAGLVVVPFVWIGVVYGTNRPILTQFQADNGGMNNHWAARSLLSQMDDNAWLVMPPPGSNGFNQAWAVRYVSWSEQLHPELQIVYPPISEPPPGPAPGYLAWDAVADRLGERPTYVLDVTDPRLSGYAFVQVSNEGGWPVGYQIVAERTEGGLVPWVSAERWQAVQDQLILP